MVRRDTIKFENDTLSKNNAKNISFSPEEEVEVQVILGERRHFSNIWREHTQNNPFVWQFGFPTQTITILDFVIDPVKIIVTLTQEKKQKLKIL